MSAPRLLVVAALSLAALPCFAQTKSPPRSPESRQLDFWIGNWDVTTDGKTKIGSSRIESIVGGCVILENYSQAGFEGKSFNFFDSVLGKWRQTWVDSFGGVCEFTGQYRDGAMRSEGETHRRDGQTILRRMTLSKLDANRVRQYSEKSTDGGETWSVAYDYIYVRHP
jgi:hypothetical protein